MLQCRNKKAADREDKSHGYKNKFTKYAATAAWFSLGASDASHANVICKYYCRLHFHEAQPLPAWTQKVTEPAVSF